MNLRASLRPLVLGLVFGGFASGYWANAQSQAVVQKRNQAGATTSPEELFKLLSPSVVVVEVLDADHSIVSRASGVVVAPNQVVTNRHVIDAGEIWRVRQGDKTWRVFVTDVDPDHDLGLLKADSTMTANYTTQFATQGDDLDAPPVSLRLSSTLAVGERVYAIGSPRGLELSLSEGLISGLRQYENGRLIQTSAALSPGSSGGGLFDAQARLVGITSFSLTESQNLNFALPAEWVQVLARPQTPSYQRQSTRESEKAFSLATTALLNLGTMVHERRLGRDRTYEWPHTGRAVSWLLINAMVQCWKNEKSPDCSDNWPLWRQASLRMLELRGNIQAAQPSRDELEGAFLDAARSAWSALVDVYCRDKPGGLYTDLEDKIRTCPNSAK